MCIRDSPWGGYRFKDLWDVKGLSCSGWNELAGVELGVMADIGDGIVINMPFSNMTYYGKELVGETIDKEYPGLFPLSVWCDDGYFEKPVSQERSSMPIHNHPSTCLLYTSTSAGFVQNFAQRSVWRIVRQKSSPNRE